MLKMAGERKRERESCFKSNSVIWSWSRLPVRAGAYPPPKLKTHPLSFRYSPHRFSKPNSIIVIDVVFFVIVIKLSTTFIILNANRHCQSNLDGYIPPLMPVGVEIGDETKAKIDEINDHGWLLVCSKKKSKNKMEDFNDRYIVEKKVKK